MSADFDLEEEHQEPANFLGRDRSVITESSDPSVESLYNRFIEGDLNIQPDFQRGYVWDTKKASKIIESILLSIPLPSIYLAESGEMQHVIDGQQRLTSLFSFIRGELPDNKPFFLSGLEVFPELNGKRFVELEKPMRNKIRNYPLRTILFLKASDPDLKFEIFERLNTGSVPLNDQELRNCIYRGPYNDLVHELAASIDFKALLGMDVPDKRRKDVELVLRFCAFQNATYLRYKPPMKRFLNEDAERFRTASGAELENIKARFNKAAFLTRSIFAANAFKRFRKGTSSTNMDGHWEQKKFNASLFDVVMYMFAEADKNLTIRNADAIREALIELMCENNEFIAAIELSTSSVQAVQKRFDIWRAEFNKIIAPGESERRSFTLREKTQLFQSDPTCQICGNRIHDLDDAAVDHIRQFAHGGPTTLTNARLAHRYCNWSRPRSE